MDNSNRWHVRHIEAIRTTARYLGVDEDIVLNEFKQKVVGSDELLAAEHRSAQATITNDGIIINKPPVVSM